MAVHEAESTNHLAPLRLVVGDRYVLSGASVHDDYTHDEAMTVEPVVPLAVVLPASTHEVSELLRHATRARLPVVARGSGTGLSGGCRPVADGILVAFDRMTGDQGDRHGEPGGRGRAGRHAGAARSPCSRPSA